MLALNYCIPDVLDCDFKDAFLAMQDYLNGKHGTKSCVRLLGSSKIYENGLGYQKVPPPPINHKE